MQSYRNKRPDQESLNILGIQYLRGIAAVMVVVYHISYQAHRLDGSFVLASAVAGVDIFFVISGFIMVVSTQAGRISAQRFLAKRLMRIAPLYWAMTLATVVLLLLVPGAFQTTVFDGWHTLASFLFVATANPQNPGFYAPLIVPGWTLCLEMFFYVCLAAGIATKQTDGRLVTLASVPIIFLVLLGNSYPLTGVAAFYTKPIMLEFVYGMVLGLVYMRTTTVIPRGLAAAMIVGLLGVILTLPTDGHWTLVGLLATAIVAAAAFSRLPKIRLLHLIGDSSYSLYLSHFVIVSILAQGWRLAEEAMVLPAWTLYVIGLPLCVAVGLMCWRLVEQPLNIIAARLMSATLRPSGSIVADGGMGR